jgi:hypothetical protein
MYATNNLSASNAGNASLFGLSLEQFAVIVVLVLAVAVVVGLIVYFKKRKH